MIELLPDWVLPYFYIFFGILGWELGKNRWRFWTKCSKCKKRELWITKSYCKINKKIYHDYCFGIGDIKNEK